MKILEDCSLQELIDEFIAREEYVGVLHCLEIGTVRRQDVVTVVNFCNRAIKEFAKTPAL